MSSLRLKGGGRKGPGGEEAGSGDLQTYVSGSLSPTCSPRRPSRVCQGTGGAPRGPHGGMASAAVLMWAGMGSVTEKGNPDPANRKPVMGRPGVRAEDI